MTGVVNYSEAVTLNVRVLDYFDSILSSFISNFLMNHAMLHTFTEPNERIFSVPCRSLR